jgi:hypothetical protein
VAFILEQAFDSSAIVLLSNIQAGGDSSWASCDYGITQGLNQAFVTKIKWKITGLPLQTKVKYGTYLSSSPPFTTIRQLAQWSPKQISIKSGQFL